MYAILDLVVVRRIVEHLRQKKDSYAGEGKAGVA